MAIALDGGYPEDPPSGSLAGQHGLACYGRKREPRAERLFSLARPDSGAAARIAADGIPEKTVVPGASYPIDQPRAQSPDISDLDARLLKESFANLAEDAEAAMEHFYARLFVRYPEIRSMFPHAMRDHMERVFAALARIVWSIDNPESLNSYLVQLGRSHRKFGVKIRHYEPFLAVLLETVRHFSGHYWTRETQSAWEAALGHAAAVMRDAAQQDAARQPPWWIGEIVQHDQRRPDLAVLTIRPDQPLRYAPGQYLAVQVPRWPRVWRNFSVANAPRENGLLDLHVRAVRGGMVSGSLVHTMRPGDTLLLGPACGAMTVSADQDRDLLCIAGGTGLAPIKAIIEEVISTSAAGRRRRKVILFFGARSEEDLYDLPDLRVLEWIYPALTVIPVVSHQPGFDGLQGMLPEVATRYGSCDGQEIFISGPDHMVRRAVRLLSLRVRAQQIHHDPPDATR